MKNRKAIVIIPTYLFISDSQKNDLINPSFYELGYSSDQSLNKSMD